MTRQSETSSSSTSEETALPLTVAAVTNEGLDLRFGLDTAIPIIFASWAASSPLLLRTFPTAAVWGECADSPQRAALCSISKMVPVILSIWKLLQLLLATTSLHHLCILQRSPSVESCLNPERQAASLLCSFCLCYLLYLLATVITPRHRHVCCKVLGVPLSFTLLERYFCLNS